MAQMGDYFVSLSLAGGYHAQTNVVSSFERDGVNYSTFNSDHDPGLTLIVAGRHRLSQTQMAGLIV
jgi:hypothetical protein